MSVTGLPGGAAAEVQVTGPGGFARSLTASELLQDLVPGTYTVGATNVSVAGHGWSPSPPVQDMPVVAATEASATVAYRVTTGALTINVLGLPAGATASLALSGPLGYSHDITGTTTIAGLAPGPYLLTGSTVLSGSAHYAPSIPTIPAITAGTTPGEVTVSYARQTGSLALSVTGLPAGIAASLTLSGPGGFTASPAASATLDDLDPGSYTLAAEPVQDAGNIWTPGSPSQVITVSAGTTTTASLEYTVTTGRLGLDISGLPAGTAAIISVTGPGGFVEHPASSQTYTGLVPGTYLIQATVVTANGNAWQPTPASQEVLVPADTTQTSASVAYAIATGGLSVTLSGLPGGASGNVTVTGPGGFTQQITATTILSGLAPGSYTVAASSVSSGGSTYAPTPASQARTVSAGVTASASVAYSSSVGGGGTLNLRIDGLYVTQAAQRYNGTVPLVAGRDGFLRVFVVANEANTAQPQVRVRLYSSGSLVQTYTITAPAASVPQSVNEGSLSNSWNVRIPAALMQPNLTVLADVDPANALAETSETDNTLPASGAPGPVDVRELPTFNLRFVPVLQSVNSLQGNVTAANAPSYLSALLKLLPVGAYDADVRAAYTTSAPALASDNANGAWGTILSEILALKSADASTQYYYGVVKTTYSSGIAGMGYVGGSARTSIGWDRLPSGSEVMAHEVGHNMGRNHAPCGGAGGPDPGYPHSGGSIGIWGLDLAALQLKSPATFHDLMGYCNPDWVSDYSWSAMLTYRQGGPNNVIWRSGDRAIGRGLLIWGRITSAGPVLEPAFVVDNADLTPPPAGPHRIEALDPIGAVMFSIPFAANDAADLPTGPEQAFAFVVPAGRALSADIAELRLVSGGRTVSRRPSAAAPPAPVFSRGADGRGLLQWNAALHPVVMVRDAATGQTLSFARGGSVRLPAGAVRLDATFSDGTRSARVLLNRQ